MPKQFKILLHTAYDDMGTIQSWSRAANYLRARDFLKTLVGGPHRVARTHFGDMDEYDIASRAQLDEFIRFNAQLMKSNPESDYGVATPPTDLQVHCMFDG